MPKIAITGAMGVGKTTLAKQISEARGFRVLPEVARVMADNGHKLDGGATPALELKIAEYQSRLEAGYDHWIADRCMVDVLCYSMVLFPDDEKLLNEINRKLADTKYDLIIYLPPEFEIENDGLRSTDHDFQKKIDEAILFILAGGPTKWYTVRGSREERLKEVLNILEYFL